MLKLSSYNPTHASIEECGGDVEKEQFLVAPLSLQTGSYLFFIILFLIPQTTIHILYGISNIRTN